MAHSYHENRPAAKREKAPLPGNGACLGLSYLPRGREWRLA